MHDLDNAGGVPAVMAQLASKGLIDTALPTVSGKTVGENIEGRAIRDTGDIRPIDDPYSATPTATAAPAPVETPATGDFPVMYLVGVIGLILICSAGLLMLRKI